MTETDKAADAATTPNTLDSLPPRPRRKRSKPAATATPSTTEQWVAQAMKHDPSLPPHFALYGTPIHHSPGWNGNIVLLPSSKRVLKARYTSAQGHLVDQMIYRLRVTRHAQSLGLRLTEGEPAFYGRQLRDGVEVELENTLTAEFVLYPFSAVLEAVPYVLAHG